MNERFAPEERRLVDYLLGRLPESERQDMLERMLADDELFRTMQSVEESLIDSYVRGMLDGVEVRLVEDHLLSSDRGQARLRTARALYEREQADARRYRLRWIAIAAMVLVAFGVGVGISRLDRGAGPPVTVAVEQPPAFISLPLSTNRGNGAIARVQLPDAQRLVFSIPIAPEDRAPRYEVRLRTPDRGDLVFPGKESPGAVTFEVGRKVLVGGRYEVELSGEDAGSRRLIAFAVVSFQ